MKTDAAYSTGWALAWAVTLTIGASTASAAQQVDFVLLFLGWVWLWLSATIARVVYPAPKHSGQTPAT